MLFSIACVFSPQTFAHTNESKMLASCHPRFIKRTLAIIQVTGRRRSRRRFERRRHGDKVCLDDFGNDLGSI